MTLKTPLGKRWLIIRSGGIGDTVLLSSVIQAIRQNESAAWIEVMGIEERVDLLVGPGMADQSVSIEQPGIETLFAEDSALNSEIQDYLKSFDIILFYTSKAQADWGKKLPIHDEQTVRIYPALPEANYPGHITDFYLAAVAGMLSIRAKLIPKIGLNSWECAAAKKRLRFPLKQPDSFLPAIHVGAGSRKKRAPIPFFLHTAQALLEWKPEKLVLTWGPADEDIGEEILPQLQTILDVIVLREEPLRSLAAMLHECDLFIGNDSGVTHIAAAVGCPTVAVFTNSNPNVWSPVGGHVRVIKL